MATKGNVAEVWSEKEIMETEVADEEEADVIQYNIAHYPADYTLSTYLDKHRNGQLIIPEFQRNFVWGQTQSSKLIESFLMGLPVPAVFLYKERKTNKLLVLDGQQRIFSVIRYLKNEFGERIFRLRGVSDRWEGKTFEELNEPERYQLLDTVLRAIVVQQLDPEDDTSVYQIFERLNTGGVNLTAMEVRKCVYLGDFVKLLLELNENISWRKLLGKPQFDRRLRDVEFILRILALYDKFDEYEKPMKHFLNKYVLWVNKKDEDERSQFIARTRELFVEGCIYLLANVGEKPFHIRRRLNYAVMDSVMSCVFTAMKQGIKDFEERYKRMLSDATYIESVTYNTSDEKVVQNRFSIAQSYMLK